MAKFCGMCGCKLEEDWFLCPKCGFKPKGIEENFVKAVTVDKTVQDVPLPQQMFCEEKETVLDKNKKKRLMVLALLALVIFTVLATGVFFLLRFIREKNAIFPSETLIISNEYGEFFRAGDSYLNLDKIDDGPVKVSCDGEEIHYTPHMVWLAEDCFYYVQNQYTILAQGGPSYKLNIYRAKFISEDEMEAELWITGEELSATFNMSEHSLVDGHCIKENSAQYLDGKLYFSVSKRYLTYGNEVTNDYLYYIDIDTKDIVCVDEDAVVSSYIIGDNDIYFTGNVGKKSGLFRMNTDGTDRELIYEIDKDELYKDNKTIGCSVMCKYKNYIYLLYDNCEVLRIRKNGTGAKKILDEKILGFEIDVKKDKAYYGVADDDEFIVYEMSLTSLKSKKFLALDNISISTFMFADDKFYFKGQGEKDEYRLKGIIYDIKKKENTGIYYNGYSETWHEDDADDYIDIG